MQAARQLAPEAWSEYLDAVSKELLNAPVSIEIIATPEPPVAQREAIPAAPVFLPPRREARMAR
jgi:hypothetical protein